MVARWQDNMLSRGQAYKYTAIYWIEILSEWWSTNYSVFYCMYWDRSYLVLNSVLLVERLWNNSINGLLHVTFMLILSWSPMIAAN